MQVDIFIQFDRMQMAIGFLSMLINLSFVTVLSPFKMVIIKYRNYHLCFALLRHEYVMYNLFAAPHRLAGQSYQLE